MVLSRTAIWLSLSAAVCGSGFWLIQAQEEPQYLVDHSDCSYFGADHEKFAHTGLKEKQLVRPEEQYRRSILTRAVASSLAPLAAAPGAGMAARDATAQPVA